MYLYATHNVVMVINVNELCGRHNVPRPLQVATRRPSRSEDVADFRSKRPARLELWPFDFRIDFGGMSAVARTTFYVNFGAFEIFFVER